MKAIKSLFTGVKQPVLLKSGIRVRLSSTKKEETHGNKEEDIYKKYKLRCFTSDNVRVDISGSLFYQVKDMKCCFNETRIREIGTSAIRSTIGTCEYDYIISDRNKINKKLQEVIGDSIKDLGIACTKFEIRSFERSNYENRKQVEQQMEAERSRRKNLLELITIYEEYH